MPSPAFEEGLPQCYNPNQLAALLLSKKVILMRAKFLFHPIIILISVFLVMIVSGKAQAIEEDVEGSHDYPLLTRMDNFYISGYEEHAYDSESFYDEEDNEYVIEGHKYVIEYSLQEGVTPPGQLKVVKNYTNAIRGIGGTILYEGDYAYMKVVQGGMETWIYVWVSDDGSEYELTIIEREPMEQEVVADPKVMAAGISSVGHVAVYGIYFDVDKADIKPESKSAIEAIAQLLNDNPSLNVYIIGHTDITGDLDYNLDLSARRAEAVMDELVDEYGIDASRMEARGVGPLCPVASNKTDEGKALNRRVEIVEML